MSLAVKRFFTNPGSRKRAVLRLAYDRATGLEDVVGVGYEDWQEFIQASAGSCDLNVIVSRIRNGEIELLRSKPGMYGDFRAVPGTMAEVLQSSIDGAAIYSNLPKEIRSKFDSFEDFSRDAGSVDWLKKLGVDFEKESEVKSDAVVE